jgi:hypothetical protein
VWSGTLYWRRICSVGLTDSIIWDVYFTLYQQKLAMTSLTGGGRSVGIVRSRSRTMELSFSDVYFASSTLIVWDTQMEEAKESLNVCRTFFFYIDCCFFNQTLHHCSEITTPKLYTWNARINEDENVVLCFLIISVTEINMSLQSYFF